MVVRARGQPPSAPRAVVAIGAHGERHRREKRAMPARTASANRVRRGGIRVWRRRSIDDRVEIASTDGARGTVSRDRCTAESGSRAGPIQTEFQTASAAGRGGWKMGSGRWIGRMSSDAAGETDSPETRGWLQSMTAAHISARASKALTGAACGTPGIPEQAAPVQGPRSCGDPFGVTGRPASPPSWANNDSMIAACWARVARAVTSCKQLAPAVEDEASTIATAAKTAPARTANQRSRARDLIIVLGSSNESPSGKSEAPNEE